MKFVTNIDEKRFNAFIDCQKDADVLQTVEWGKFKSSYDWTMELVGMEDSEGQLIGAAMLLRRKIPLIPRTILYAPRGFVLDYTHTKLLENFTKAIKQYAKKSKAIFVKIDPPIKFRDHDMEGNVIEGIDNSSLIEKLKGLGYVHKGTNLDFEGVQPRFVFILDIDRDKEQVLEGFHHKTRYNIRLATKKGIEIYEGSREDLVDFERIMKVTGERDDFITRPLSYFQKMYDHLVPTNRMKLFMAKYNVKKALDALNIDIEKELKNKTQDQNRLEKLEEQKRELKELVVKHPDGIIVSGTILLMTENRAWYVYGASDNIYRNLMPNYLIQWEMIQYAMDRGCTVYDFRGISGDLSPDNPLYGLYRFKKGFNGEFVEYIGEFDLVVSRLMYFIWEFGLPKIKKLLRKIRR